jgi:SulP family sulfate permease
VLVYTIDGPFFFAAVDSLQRALAQSHTDPRVVILRLSRVPFIDITGLHAIDEVIGDFEGRGVMVGLCEANDRVRMKLTRAGIIEPTGRTPHDTSLAEALDRFRYAIVGQPEPVAAVGARP